MDLFIETLTGTAFELRVSPFDTIISIKAKIQRLEGIPISQQHLIWQSMELEDDLCLHDFDISDGATLKLVLAMRGGPINTRRISIEEPSFEEMADYMEANRSEIFEKLMKDNRQVTLLVFRDGDQLNFFRVHDRGDGTLTPLSESLSAASMHNLYDEEDDEDQGIPQEKKDENELTKRKMQKIRAQMANVSIKKKPSFVPRPPSSGAPGSSFAKRRLRFANPARNIPQKRDTLAIDDLKGHKSRHCRSRRKTEDTEQHQQQKLSSNSELVGKTTQLPPVTSRNRNADLVDVSDIISAGNLDSKIIHDLSMAAAAVRQSGNDNERRFVEPTKSTTTATNRSSDRHGNVKEILMKNSRSGQPLKKSVSGNRRDSTSERDNILNSVNSLLRRAPSSPSNEETPSKGDLINGSRNEDYDDGVFLRTKSQLKTPPLHASLDSSSTTKLRRSKKLKPRITDKTGSHHNALLRKDSLKESTESRLTDTRLTETRLFRRQRLCSPEETVTGIMRGEPSGLRSFGVSLDTKAGSRLPHVESKTKIPPQLVHTGRKRIRCFLCAKKLGLATNYQCRCGNTFCATHRYAEAHSCTYDYKSEGRKVLEQNNPVVTAPKLPKI
eukprot:gene12803-14116_t